MKIEIHYCGQWNYLPTASRLEEELNKEITSEKLNIVLIKGSGGVFDVVVNDKLIYSKSDTERFPLPNEIAEIIKRG